MTLDLDPIRARLAAAKLGKLITRVGKHRDLIELTGPFAIKLGNLDAAKPEQADLIANAPTDMAALLAEVERLRVAVWRVREVHSLQVSSVWGEVCEECVDAYTERHKPYPCPTLRAAEGVE